MEQAHAALQLINAEDALICLCAVKKTKATLVTCKQQSLFIEQYIV